MKKEIEEKAESYVNESFTTRRMKNSTYVVHNAIKPRDVVVTEKDVADGLQRGPEACAAAISCLRQGDVTDVRIHVSTAYLKVRGKWTRYRVPQAMRTQIIEFDQHKKFEPGVYTLVPIQPSHRASGERQGSAGNGEKVRVTRSPARVLVGVRSRAPLWLK